MVIKDIPHPSNNIPECVSRTLDHLDDCAFPRSKALGYPPVNAQTAEVEDVHLIDPMPVRDVATEVHQPLHQRSRKQRVTLVNREADNLA